MTGMGFCDSQIMEFHGPTGPSPVPSAVGASIALDKICSAVANMEEPVSVMAV